jgi:hypothetical protein
MNMTHAVGRRVSEISTSTESVVRSCALVATGRVDCWGSNTYGDLGNGTTADSSTPVAVSAITNATAISAGGLHSCALVAAGRHRLLGLQQLRSAGERDAHEQLHPGRGERDSVEPRDCGVLVGATERKTKTPPAPHQSERQARRTGTRRTSSPARTARRRRTSTAPHARCERASHARSGSLHANSGRAQRTLNNASASGISPPREGGEPYAPCSPIKGHRLRRRAGRP